MNLNEVLNLPLVLNDWPTPEDYPRWFRAHPTMSCEEVFEKHYVKRVVALRYWRSRLSEAQNHKCCWCGVVMTELRDKSNSSTIEHVVCRSKGGANHPDNYAISCDKCNNKRGDLDAETFLNQIKTSIECTKAAELRALTLKVA